MAMIPPRRCFSWKAWQPKGPAFSPDGYPVVRTDVQRRLAPYSNDWERSSSDRSRPSLSQ